MTVVADNPPAVIAESPRAVTAAHLDGWRNLYTTYGTDRDRTTAVEFQHQRRNYLELREMLRGDDLLQVYVEEPAKAMLRGGVRVGTGNRDLDDAARGRFDDARLISAVGKAYEFARAYGLGAVGLEFDDGMSPAMPVQRGARLRRTRVYDASELRAETLDWDLRPGSPTYGEPRLWTANERLGGLTKIHPSRLLVIPGRVVSSLERYERLGAGESGMDRFARLVADFDGGIRALLNILSDFSVGVLGMKGLAELVATDSAQVVHQRALAFDMARSAGRIVPVDAELESYSRVTASIAGFSEALDRLMMRLAAAARMPVTVLFGRSPAGLSATGESDIRGWYDSLDGCRMAELHPLFDRVTGYVLDELSGGRYDGDYTVSFAPLWQPTEKEIAETRYVTAQTDAIYMSAGAVDPDEVAHSRFGGEEYSAETTLDRKARDLTQRVLYAEKLAPVAAPTVAAATGAAPENLAATALNGAQVTAALEIVGKVAARELPRDAALGMLQAFFQLSAASADAVLGEVGRTFFSSGPAPAAAPAPFGGGNG